MTGAGPNACNLYTLGPSPLLHLNPHRFPPAQQARQQLPFSAYLIRPDAPVLHDEFIERHIHRSSFPDFAHQLQRHRPELVHRLPCESNLQALRRPIIRKAANPAILNGMVFAREWFHEVLTVDNPTPTTRAPVRFGRPMVNFILRDSNWLVFTAKILSCDLRLRRYKEIKIQLYCRCFWHSGSFHTSLKFIRNGATK